jgi:heat shock protein HslJ
MKTIKLINMKTVVLLFLSSILLLSFGCSDDNDLPKGEGDIITNIKWKLTGFVDGLTGVSKEPDPKDCSDCYWIYFDADKTFTGKSSVNFFGGTYESDESTIQITDLLTTEIGGIYADENAYIKNITEISVFSVTADKELKLYYNEKKDYLLFKHVSNQSDTINLTKIKIADRPCETLEYIGQLDYDFDSALDSLVKLKNISGEIQKVPLTVIFDHDDRYFCGIIYGECANYADVLDSKGNYYSRTWYCPEDSETLGILEETVSVDFDNDDRTFFQTNQR